VRQCPLFVQGRYLITILRISGRLAQRTVAAVAASAVILLIAGASWLMAVAWAWEADCPGPGATPTGLDRGVSLVPPGASCSHDVGSGAYATYMFHPHGWLWVVVLVLLVSSAAALLLAVGVEIRQMRQNERPA
jgi:hypothetical protein